jgi:hypothetical protein
VADNPRIDELRRRVDKDPASIAFAQLAADYRRTDEYDASVTLLVLPPVTQPGMLGDEKINRANETGPEAPNCGTMPTSSGAAPL